MLEPDIYFDSKSDEVLIGLSQIAAQTVKVNGTFLARRLQVIPHRNESGWDSLEIGANGIMKFQPEGDFLVNYIKVGVNGYLEAYTPIKLWGHNKYLQIIIASGASILFDSKFDIMNVSSTVAAESVQVEGTFLPKQLQIISHGNRSGWDSLEIGVNGIMKFQPEGDFVCNYIKVSGHMESYTNITVHGHSARLEMIVVAGARILFDSKSGEVLVALSQIAARIVKVDGTFIARRLQVIPHRNESGWDSLEIGVDGIMKFQPEGDFLVNYIKVGVNGYLEAYTPIKLWGHNKYLQIIIARRASILFDSKSDIMNVSSTVAAESVQVEGTFLPKQLQIISHGNRSGWDSLEIGVNGIMKFQPGGDFLVNDIKVRGHFESYTNITVRGHSAQHEMIVYTGATILLDSNSNHPYGPWTGHSCILAAKFKMERNTLGKAGYISLTIDRIDVDGQLTFEASSVVLTDTVIVGVNGNVQTASSVPMRGLTANRTSSFTVRGYMKLDTRGNHDTHEWSSTDASVFLVSNLVVGTAARLFAGHLSLGEKVETLTVGVNGKFEYEPATTFHINSTEIAGQVKSYTPMSDGTHLKGELLDVKSTGTLDMDYNGDVNDSDSGCLPSYVHMITIDITGTVQAGSLFVDTNDINVGSTGKMIVNYGGYDSGSGPGKKTCHNISYS